MKSKIPCEPGPAPLMKLAQATGLCGGVLVPRLLKPPPARSFSRLGSRPAFIMLSESRGSIPSTPITITFLPRLRETWLPRPEPVVAHAQPARRRRRPTAAVPVEQGPSVHLRGGCIGHQTTSARVSSRSPRAFSRRGPPRSAPCRPCSRGPPRRTSTARWGRCRSGAGSRSPIGRLQNRMPGTSDGSTQWSPLQAFVLAWKTSVGRRPIAASHETR